MGMPSSYSPVNSFSVIMLIAALWLASSTICTYLIENVAAAFLTLPTSHHPYPSTDWPQ